MRVFLDTEFSDFTDPKLISFGLVAENGQAFFLELADGWNPKYCNSFVMDAIIPLLHRDPSTRISRNDAGIPRWIPNWPCYSRTWWKMPNLISP